MQSERVSMRSILARCIFATSLVAAMAGCGSTGDSTQGGYNQEEPGSLSVAITAADDVAGFQIEIAQGTTVVFSQFAPSTAPDAGSPRSFVSTTLKPGDYAVTATPMRAPGMPSPD